MTLEFNKPEESAFNVLDYALQAVYADNPDVSSISYDPLWIEVMKEARVSTERLKSEPAAEIARYILGLFDLKITRIDSCIVIGRNVRTYNYGE